MTVKPPNKPREHLEGTADSGSSQSLLRLQRAVLKLALSFRGQNPRLDELLKRLGSLMKGGRRDAEIQILIDDIVEVIVSNDVARDPRQLAAGMIGEMLEHLAPKPAWRDQTRALQRRLQDLESADDLPRYLKEAAELVNAQLRAPFNGHDERDPKARAGEDNLARLLARLDAPPELQHELARIRTRLEQHASQAQILESVEETARLISQALATNVTAPAASATAAWHGARTSLLQFLDQVTLPEKLVPELAALKSGLASAADDAQVGQSVAAIAGLIAKARALLEHEITELREFLRAVLERLSEVKDRMAESGLVHLEALQSTVDFERLMAAQFEDMRETIADEPDLNALKDQIENHLSTIDAGLKDFAQREKHRHSEAKTQLGSVVDKLNALEEETKSLRESLAEQRSRSLMDSLTGVLNRIGYDEAMDREYARWQRHGGTLCIAVVDVDYFKSVNDRFGHTAGDKVLSTVATLVKRSIRQSDILCRYGGEEFSLILPQTELGGGIAAMEKIRAIVADSNFRFRETPVPVTISIGIAEFHMGDEPGEVFDRADRAMYLAKELGRNRCCSERDVPYVAAPAAAATN
ncbi:MAG: diguanylate cyclase [Gammaproteobacteria bacterium]|nr:diguanylate cyclase [Gammaproteobacteria bacterium]